MHPEPIPYATLAPAAFRALLALSNTVNEGALGLRLHELIHLRISQRNGCGFCIDMHWRALVGAGEDPRHLNTLVTWRESPFFSPKDRAVLELAERIHEGAGDDATTPARAQLSDAEIAEVGFAVAVITAWNRLNVAFHTPVPTHP